MTGDVRHKPHAATKTKTQSYPWQTKLLPELMEHHEELHRQRPLQDTHACKNNKPHNKAAVVWLLKRGSCNSSRLSQVNFNEPLSMLQRLTEDLEYSELLDRAARCDSTLEQMCLVAAFSVSSYSTTVHRTAKPFNPLLGETYELDRLDEFGYRSICEQVRRRLVLTHCSLTWKGPVCNNWLDL